MLSEITPVILTYNEAPNIERTLAKVTWARDIVMVDSGSTDETLAIANRYSSVQVVHREFDSFASQCNFGLTQVRTDWVLSLDADYVLTDELIAEIRALRPADSTSAYFVRFKYCVDGQQLRGAAYPPRRVLYRRNEANYENDGHAHHVRVTGETRQLSSFILHDDRKSFDHWLRSQKLYAKLETQKLRGTRWRELEWPDRIRKLRVVAPIAMPLYCLFVKGGILDGRAGLYYAYQRMLAELTLSRSLFENGRRPRGIADCELRIADCEGAKREEQSAKR